MKETYRIGAVGALLDEYEKAISELQQVIQTITDADLIRVTDTSTLDPNCRSIQTVLAHVVSSAFSYAIYIESLYGKKTERPQKVLRENAKEYIVDLNNAFQFTVQVFEMIQDSELEQQDPLKKIATSWGQVYDIEQIMEHAIVHILRHRRQIQKFKMK